MVILINNKLYFKKIELLRDILISVEQSLYLLEMSVSPKENSYETMLLMNTAFSIVEEHNHTLAVVCAKKLQSSNTAYRGMVDSRIEFLCTPGLQRDTPYRVELQKKYIECVRLRDAFRSNASSVAGMKKATNAIQLALLLSTKQLDSKEDREADKGAFACGSRLATRIAKFIDWLASSIVMGY